jgi:hypothetical protein
VLVLNFLCSLDFTGLMKARTAAKRNVGVEILRKVANVQLNRMKV